MTRYSITLDLTKYTTQLSVPCKNTDVGREIAITLHQNGVPYTLTADNFAVFVSKNSAGADIVNDCVVDHVNNCVVYKITPQTIANGGNIPCEIQLFGYDREQIGSPTFNILVRKSILGETNIESSDEYGTLNAIINDIRRSLEAGEFDGKSAYQYAVEYGYEGSEEEFGTILADLKTYKEYTDQHLFDHDEAIAELQGDNEQLYMIADEVLSKADNHEKRITNLEKGLPADRYVTDESVAYVKRIPTNACPFAAVEKVGGMTKKSENLIPFPYYMESQTINGVTFTVQDNGSIIVNGTATANARFDLMAFGSLTFKAGEYHSLTGCPKGGASNTYRLTFSSDPGGEDLQDIGNGFTKLCKTDASLYGFYIYVASGTTVNNLVFLPKLEVSATPTPYEKKYEGLRNAKVTAIESKGASGNSIGQMDIPTEVQELDGYGEGAGTASNGIVWENGEVWYEKKVHTIDLGALNWEVQNTNRFVAYLPTDKIAKPTGSYKISANAVCSKYDNLPQDTLYANKVGIAIQATAGTTVYVYDTTYSDATTFKSAMNGVSLCYEMQTPERFEIDDLITADNLIEVEGGGTLTFVNEYGAAAASDILYQVKEAS